MSAIIKPRWCTARAQALGLKMRIAAKGTEEKKAGKPAGSKPGDGDMKLEEITSEVETGYDLPGGSASASGSGCGCGCGCGCG